MRQQTATGGLGRVWCVCVNEFVLRVFDGQHGHGAVFTTLVWLWMIEGQAPTRADLIGAALAISGALIIIGLAVRVR